MIDVGWEMRQLRLMARLTQEEAGDILEVSTSTISKIENNQQDMTVREYLRWKEVYGGVQRVASFTYNPPTLAIGS